jgi:hypothetical protein
MHPKLREVPLTFLQARRSNGESWAWSMGVYAITTMPPTRMDHARCGLSLSSRCHSAR